MSENQQTTTRSRSHTQRKRPPRKKPHKKLWKRIILWLVLLMLAGIVALGGLFAYYATSTPSLTVSDLEGAIETQILDKDGELVTELGGENRDVIAASDVPQTLKDAVTSIEDKRFYSHIGIDPIRIAGSFLSNLRNRSITQGGSTITQQLVKLSVFSTKKEDQTYRRKIQEIILALQLEREYSKEQILTYYLNKVYMANNVYGFGTAANYYYGKPLSELSLPQLALLAGMPQAPNTYDPYANPDAAKERRDLVLRMMQENGKITADQYQQAIATPIDDGLLTTHADVASDDNKLIFDSFLSMVLDEVREKTGLDPYNDGLKIETTVDSGAQKELYNILNTTEYVNYVNDDMQAAVVMLDSTTGAVRAINGGRKQTNLLAYNRAIQADRSTGSTIKPLIDYGPAIEYLNYSTGTTIVDKPTKFSNGFDLNNWDRQYMGAMTMRRALVLSRNTPAFQTFQAVGEDNAQAFLKKLDITIENDGTESLVENNSIGAYISPLKMAAAYAAFANYGTYSKPYTVTKVTTRDGQVYNFTSEQHQAMKDSTAYMITDVLKDSFTYGFATQLGSNNRTQAAKTGTTNYTDEQLRAMGRNDLVPDSWFIGYSTNYTISVWTGYDNAYESGNGLDATEQGYSKLIYGALMRYAQSHSTVTDWTQPSSVVSAPIIVGSNPLVIANGRSSGGNISTELFVKGTVPTQSTTQTTVDRQLAAPTGLSAQYDRTRRELTVTWDNYTTTERGAVTYEVSAGGQTQTVSTNRATFDNVTGATVTVSLRVSVGSETSPPLSIELQINNDEQSSTSETTTTEENASNNSRTNSRNPQNSDQENATTQEPTARSRTNADN